MPYTRSNRMHQLGVVLLLCTACGQSNEELEATVATETEALTAQPQSVREALAHLNAACEAAAALVSPDDDPATLLTEFSRRVGLFWQGVYRASLPKQAVDTSTDSPADAIFEAGVETDLEVISALFTPSFLRPNTPPVRRDLTLMLLGDAVTSLNDRLAASISLHDFACGFIGCREARKQTETSEMMAVLGSLADASRLKAALAESTHLRDSWRRAFSLIEKQHSWLEGAVAASMGAKAYSPTLLHTVRPMEAPDSLAQLASVVRSTEAWSANYRRTGLFEPDSLKALYAGIQTRRNEQFKEVVALRKRELSEALSHVESDLDRLVQNKREALRGARDQSLRNAELTQVRTEMEHLRKQLKNLRLRISQDEAAFSDRVSAFKTELETTEWDREARQQIGSTQHLSISAAQARDDLSDPTTGRAVLHEGAPWTLSVSPGDMLNIQVTGQYSPTCALQQAGSTFALAEVQGAMCGPEGFQQQASAGTYKLQQVDHSTDKVTSHARSNSVEDAGELHAGFSAKNVPVIGGLLDIGGSISHRESGRTEHNNATSERDAATTIDGRESRTGAAFAHGIRSDRTPFPRYPVGSLLLVQVNAANQVTGVDVVRGPHTAVVATGTKTFFVVNDLAGCRAPPDALQVQVVNLRRFGSDGLASAMGLVTEFLRDRANALRDDPGLGATAPALQSETTAVMVRHGVPVDNLPPAVQALFKAWLDKELLNFERKVAVVSLERQIEAMALRAKAYTHDLEQAEDDARLLALLPYWSLRSLGVQSLLWKARALTDYIMENQFPVLELFYPEVVTRLRGEHLFHLQVNELLHQPWVTKPAGSGRSLGVIHSLIDAVTMIETRIADAEARRNRPAGTKFQTVAVTFPRPGANVASPWAKGDEVDALQLWRAIQYGGRATITVRPDHLYSRDTLRPAILECDMKLPIIRSMGVVFTVPETSDISTLNTFNFSVTPRVGPNLLFPQERAGATYDLSSAEVDWRKPRLRRLFSTEGLAEQIFEQLGSVSQAADGLSPFTTFEFELPAGTHSAGNDSVDGSVVKAIKQATEMTLFFQLETRATEEKMVWIGPCQPGL